MRILFVHPNYRSGGAEIAGTWPPAWVAYLTGHLRQSGFDDIHFIDAMTDGLSDADLAQKMEALAPDVVGVTAVDRSRTVLPEAARGPQVLLAAPGGDVAVAGD